MASIEDIKKQNIFSDNRYNSIIEETNQIITSNNLKKLGIEDTPISPVSIDNDDIPIYLSESVGLEYRKLVELINKPETAIEYAYVMLGNLREFDSQQFYYIDKIIYCGNDLSTLNSRAVEFNQEKLNESLKVFQNPDNKYNFISLMHTHPNIPENERENTIVNYLSQEVKEREYIRDAGLNISLQDFVQYEALYQFYKDYPNIKTCQTIIMYNGEIAMFSKENGIYKRFTDIINLSTLEPIYVSSKEDYKLNKVK